jgi:hypothetical protein
VDGLALALKWQLGRQCRLVHGAVVGRQHLRARGAATPFEVDRKAVIQTGMTPRRVCELLIQVKTARHALTMLGSQRSERVSGILNANLSPSSMAPSSSIFDASGFGGSNSTRHRYARPSFCGSKRTFFTPPKDRYTVSIAESGECPLTYWGLIRILLSPMPTGRIFDVRC